MLHIVRILAITLIGLTPLAAVSQDSRPRHGLMWQSTGLPAVFPLQIKTLAGRDYYLQLRSDKSGEPVLAGFIRGGTFFKVLVPPGRFWVTVYAGQIWLNEEKLFGAGALTDVIELDDPLTFGVRGLSKKAGHLIDLTNTGPGKMADISLKSQSICQTYGIDPTHSFAKYRVQFHEFAFPLAYETPNWYQRRYLAPPKLKVRSRPC